MRSISFDDGLVARLERRAKRSGVSVDELAERAIEEYLGASVVESAPDPFAFFGIESNPDVQAEIADRMLGDGFGR